MTLQLVDRSITRSYGVIEDVLVRVKYFIFPVDFMVMDVSEDISKHKCFVLYSFKIISLNINYLKKIISPNLKDSNKLQLFHIGERRRGRLCEIDGLCSII